MVDKHQEVISLDMRKTISKRYKRVTQVINRKFWNIESDIQHSLYVGSYGRGTAIDTSDIDVLVELPSSEYFRFNQSKSNGQSRLLQAIRLSLLITYPNSDIRADGQIVKINFSDSIKFEILPAFEEKSFYSDSNMGYKYPDSNMGGNWRSTNPKKEQIAMKEKNMNSKGLLFDTCKHIRYIRDSYYKSYHLSGILIDSFVYEAIGGWKWVSGETSSPSGTYENRLYEYFLERKAWYNSYGLNAPGSNQSVEARNDLECFEKILRKMKGK